MLGSNVQSSRAVVSNTVPQKDQETASANHKSSSPAREDSDKRRRLTRESETSRHKGGSYSERPRSVSAADRPRSSNSKDRPRSSSGSGKDTTFLILRSDRRHSKYQDTSERARGDRQHDDSWDRSTLGSRPRSSDHRSQSESRRQEYRSSRRKTSKSRSPLRTDSRVFNHGHPVGYWTQDRRAQAYSSQRDGKWQNTSREPSASEGRGNNHRSIKDKPYWASNNYTRGRGRGSIGRGSVIPSQGFFNRGPVHRGRGRGRENFNGRPNYQDAPADKAEGGSYGNRALQNQRQYNGDRPQDHRNGRHVESHFRERGCQDQRTHSLPDRLPRPMSLPRNHSHPEPRKHESAYGSQHACGSIGMYAMSYKGSQEKTPAPGQQPSSPPLPSDSQQLELREDPLQDSDLETQEKEAHIPKELSAERDAEDPLMLGNAYMSDDGNVPDPGDKSEDEKTETPLNGLEDKDTNDSAITGGGPRLGDRLSFAWKADARRSSGELAAPNVFRSPKRSRFEDESAQAKRQAADTDPLTQCWYYLDPLNVQQGPCSITQLHAWLAALAGRPDLDEAYQQFKAISVWTKGMPRRIPMLAVLAMHASSSAAM